MSSALDLVLQHPVVWRGDGCARAALPGVPTGYAEIDAWLPGGGWPAGALTEIHVERPGVGELNLFMPAAARLTRAGQWLALVSPPYLPYAPALATHGVRLARLMLVRPASDEDGLWACEQALRSQACAAVFAWFDRLHEHAVRRLQRAAEAGGASMLLFRPARAAAASPAALRIHVSRSQDRTLVRILKRRGGGLPAPIALDLHDVPSASCARTVAVPVSGRGHAWPPETVS